MLSFLPEDYFSQARWVRCKKRENVVTEKRGCDYIHPSSSSYKVNNSGDNCCNNDPKELEPVEKWDIEKLWISMVVKWWPEHNDERDDEQKQKPAAVLV